MTYSFENYALYVFESICLLLFRKDLMLTQVMPYCNQAPHTIFKIKCEELYFKEMWKHKISWKWCISFAFIWCWEIMCQNVNLFEWIQWYYWHENQMLTYLNESNSIIDMKSYIPEQTSLKAVRIWISWQDMKKTDLIQSLGSWK